MATLMRDCMINLPHYRKKSLRSVPEFLGAMRHHLRSPLCTVHIRISWRKVFTATSYSKKVPFCNNFRMATISIPRKNTSANPLCIIGLKPKIKKIKLNFKFWRCYKFGNHKNSLMLQLSSQWLVGNGWFYLELIREIPRSKSAFPF